MRLRAAASILAAALVVASAWACSSDGGGAATGKVCPPGKSVFCRCQDRSEGSKTCNDDGSGYSPCDPCIGGELIEDDAGFEPFDSGGPGNDAPASGCGNGVVDPGEDCDDKNTKSGDGCSASCKLDGNPESARTCPGMPVDLWDVEVVYDGTTATYSTTFKASPSCGADAGGAVAGSTAPDRVFKVTPHKSGTLTVAVTKATFDAMIYAASTCAVDMVHGGACVNARTGTGDETLTTLVTADKPIYVVIDGTSTTQSGTFHVRFAVN